MMDNYIKEQRINMKLAEKQGLTEEEILEVKRLHKERDSIQSRMKVLDPKEDKEELLSLLFLWRLNEYALQAAWKFEKNSNYHREYMIPHCTCPKMDNDDCLGTGIRYITQGCVYHYEDEGCGTNCISCDEEDKEVCLYSKKECKHHCNHSWTHDVCCWCSKEWNKEIE